MERSIRTHPCGSVLLRCSPVLVPVDCPLGHSSVSGAGLFCFSRTGQVLPRTVDFNLVQSQDLVVSGDRYPEKTGIREGRSFLVVLRLNAKGRKK